MSLVTLAACSTNTAADPIDVGHVHDIVERDGDLLLGTHQGLFQLEGGVLRRVGDEIHDLMSVAVLRGGDVVASGHPDMRMEKYRVEGAPSFLGLVRSEDAGENWDVVDLLGQVDFHALTPTDSVLYGGGSSGTIWEFPGGESAGRALGGIEQDLRDLAASTTQAGVLMTTSFEGRVAITDDAAQTWEILTDVPSLTEIEWTREQITAIDIEGGVWEAGQPRGPYRRVGEAPDEVDALLVDTRAQLWIATHDGSIWSSSDGSEWNLELNGSQ